MSISIRNPRAEELAREVSELCHISMTQAIIEALEEKKEKNSKRSAPEELRLEIVLGIAERCASLPDMDTRNPDEILGYNSCGGF